MKEIEHVLRHYKSAKDPKTTSSDSTKDSYACSYINSQITNINTEMNNLKENYSETEQEIGTWIDGKPLYQKVIKQTVNLNSFGQSYNVTIGSNIDHICMIDIMAIQENGPYFPLPFAGPFTDMTGYGVGIQNFSVKDNSYLEIWLYTGTQIRKNYDIYHIVKYTKTTDSIPQNNTRTKKKGAKK